MAIELRDPTAPYEADLNNPTQNQLEVGQALFELIQALRQEASAQDPDSPGVLTPVEIFQQAIARVPGAAMAITDLVQDDQALLDDLAEVGNILRNQLTVQVEEDEDGEE